MQADIASKIISQRDYIDGPTSRMILRKIIRKEALEPNQDVSHHDKKRLEKIAHKYTESKTHSNKTNLRNEAFYKIIQEQYNGFSWEETSGGVKVNFNGFSGIMPSLCAFLLGQVPINIITKDPFDDLPDDISNDLDLFCLEHSLKSVEPNGRQLFAEWIKKGLQGEPLSIVSPVCPDYSKEIIDNGPKTSQTPRHRFTFESLGSGLGVTASHLFECIPTLQSILNDKYKIPFTHFICPGDFEGFSAENCERLKINESQFLKQVKEQSLYIKDNAPGNTNMVVSVPFTELGHGKKGWLKELSNATERITSGDLAYIRDEPWVIQTALGRKGLYDRWFGNPEVDDSFYINKCLEQAAEYTAMGQIVLQNHLISNPLIIGADDRKMGRFYALAGDIPILYLERRYET